MLFHCCCSTCSRRRAPWAPGGQPLLLQTVCDSLHATRRSQMCTSTGFSVENRSTQKLSCTCINVTVHQLRRRRQDVSADHFSHAIVIPQRTAHGSFVVTLSLESVHSARDGGRRGHTRTSAQQARG